MVIGKLVYTKTDERRFSLEVGINDFKTNELKPNRANISVKSNYHPKKQFAKPECNFYVYKISLKNAATNNPRILNDSILLNYLNY